MGLREIHDTLLLIFLYFSSDIGDGSLRCGIVLIAATSFSSFIFS
jgi:hypothetical protein